MISFLMLEVPVPTNSLWVAISAKLSLDMNSISEKKKDLLFAGDAVWAQISAKFTSEWTLRFPPPPRRRTRSQIYGQKIEQFFKFHLCRPPYELENEFSDSKIHAINTSSKKISKFPRFCWPRWCLLFKAWGNQEVYVFLGSNSKKFQDSETSVPLVLLIKSASTHTHKKENKEKEKGNNKNSKHMVWERNAPAIPVWAKWIGKVFMVGSHLHCFTWAFLKAGFSSYPLLFPGSV